MARKTLLSILILILFVSGCTYTEIEFNKTGLNEITIEELWNSKDEYLGKEFVVTGVIEQILPRCTAAVCTEENPCCNGCGSDLGFVIDKDAMLPLQDLSCKGTNCEIDCPLVIGEVYTLKVVLHKNEFDDYSLELMEINNKTYLDIAKGILKTSNASYMENYRYRNCEIIGGSEHNLGVFELLMKCKIGPSDCSFLLYNNSNTENIGCTVPPEYPNQEKVITDN